MVSIATMLPFWACFATVATAQEQGVSSAWAAHPAVLNQIYQVMSVAISPDARFVVSGSWDRTVRVWDATTWTLAHTLTGHTDYVMSVAVSPDAQFVVSGSYDDTVRVWDTTTWTLDHTLTGLSRVVRSVVWGRANT